VLAETLNLAAIWTLPLVFACENNGYAVTLPSKTTIAGSVTGRAAAYGMPARRVDGMDVEQVLAATQEAVARARDGGGPSFLEFETYRFVGHNTGERYLGLHYRTDEEVDGWRLRDPLVLTGRLLDRGAQVRIDVEAEELLDDAVSFARNSPPPTPDTALGGWCFSRVADPVGVNSLGEWSWRVLLSVLGVGDDVGFGAETGGPVGHDGGVLRGPGRGGLDLRGAAPGVLHVVPR